MHRALIVAVALLGLALFALFGRGGDESPSDAGAASETRTAAQQAAAEAESQEAVGAAEELAARRLLEERVEPVLDARQAEVPGGPDEPAAAGAAGAAPGDGARLDDETLAATQTGRQADDRPSPRSGASGPTSTRGGAFANPRCPVSLNRLFLARGVEEREPIGVGTVFSSDDQRVYVFMDVNNARGPEQDMVIYWDHLGSEHTYEQRIPAGPYPRWRTWVYHTMRRPLAGDWYVRVTDRRGCALGEVYFEATPYRGS